MRLSLNFVVQQVELICHCFPVIFHTIVYQKLRSVGLVERKPTPGLAWASSHAFQLGAFQLTGFKNYIFCLCENILLILLNLASAMLLQFNTTTYKSLKYSWNFRAVSDGSSLLALAEQPNFLPALSFPSDADIENTCIN